SSSPCWNAASAGPRCALTPLAESAVLMSSTVRRYFAPAAPLDWRSVNDTRPITFPLLSTTGPPLSPGSMFAWISMSLLVPSVLMLLTLPNTFVGVVTPVCSAVVEEPGYPSAVTGRLYWLNGLLLELG